MRQVSQSVASTAKNIECKQQIILGSQYSAYSDLSEFSSR